MYSILSRVFLFLLLSVTGFFVQAQDSLQKAKPEMAGLMRSNGKIYVVVTVLVIILTGLFLYLINLDKKLSRLEKDRK